MSESVIKNKSYEFAIKIVELYKILAINNREFVMSKQMLRSGASIGANVREAINAQSKVDFIHKLSIAQKECDETIYWLELLKQTNFIIDKEFSNINQDANEILKILKSIIITSKQNINNS